MTIADWDSCLRCFKELEEDPGKGGRRNELWPKTDSNSDIAIYLLCDFKQTTKSSSKSGIIRGLSPRVGED